MASDQDGNQAKRVLQQVGDNQGRRIFEEQFRLELPRCFEVGLFLEARLGISSVDAVFNGSLLDGWTTVCEQRRALRCHCGHDGRSSISTMDGIEQAYHTVMPRAISDL